MPNEDISVLVKGIIETQVIQALNNAPEAIEKLVKAALSKPVTKGGSFDGYGDKMPYLDYLVGEEIRNAANAAVHKVISEQAPLIEAQVRAGLSSESIVAAFTKSIVTATSKDWNIRVNFESTPSRD